MASRLVGGARFRARRLRRRRWEQQGEFRWIVGFGRCDQRFWFRTGDIDPAAVFHLVRVAGMSIDEIDHLFNRESGMKGLTGQQDMREVWKLVDAGDQNARDAIDVYVHRLLKYVGAYIAVMGGVDAITFTAGIGENDSRVRAELCRRLSYLGVRIDAEANDVRASEPVTISTPESTTDRKSVV